MPSPQDQGFSSAHLSELSSPGFFLENAGAPETRGFGSRTAAVAANKTRAIAYTYRHNAWRFSEFGELILEFLKSVSEFW